MDGAVCSYPGTSFLFSLSPSNPRISSISASGSSGKVILTSAMVHHELITDKRTTARRCLFILSCTLYLFHGFKSSLVGIAYCSYRLYSIECSRSLVKVVTPCEDARAFLLRRKLPIRPKGLEIMQQIRNHAKTKRVRKPNSFVSVNSTWCAREDLNLHAQIVGTSPSS